MRYAKWSITSRELVEAAQSFSACAILSIAEPRLSAASAAFWAHTPWRTWCPRRSVWPLAKFGVLHDHRCVHQHATNHHHRSQSIHLVLTYVRFPFTLYKSGTHVRILTV